MTDRLYDDVVKKLESAVASARCDDVTRLLRQLGFTVRDGKLGGHKVFVHHGLPGFHSGSYNCDHGRNPQIKPVYVRKVVRILREYEHAIRKHLRGDE